MVSLYKQWIGYGKTCKWRVDSFWTCEEQKQVCQNCSWNDYRKSIPYIVILQCSPILELCERNKQFVRTVFEIILQTTHVCLQKSSVLWKSKTNCKCDFIYGGKERVKYRTLVGWDALFVGDLGFYIFDCVIRFTIERNSFPGKSPANHSNEMS